MRQTKRMTALLPVFHQIRIVCLSFLLAGSFLLSVFSLTTLVAYAAPAYTLSVSNNQPITGREVRVQVIGQGLSDVYATELQATFNTDHLRFISASSTRFGYAVTPAVNGSQIVLAFTKVGPISGETGTVVLAEMVFEATALGSGTVELKKVETVDSAINVVDFDANAIASLRVVATSNDSGQGNPGQTSSVSTPEPEGVKVQKDTGGKVENNGAAVNLPAGAVGSDIYVSIKKLSDTSHLKPDPDLKLAGDVYEIIKDVAGPFQKPVTITLPFNTSLLDDEHEVALYWYNEETAKWVKLDDIKIDLVKGTVSGSVTHFTKFAVLASAKSASVKPPALTDIKGHWAEAGIQKLVKAGVIDGYQDGTFQPDSTVTRSEFVSMIVRVFHLTATGGTAFSDTGSHWAKDAIAIASAMGIVVGYEDGTFGPDDNITREQMAVILARAAQLASANSGLDYKDSGDVSAWAQGPLAALTAKGVLNGYEDGTLKPKAFSTRAEAAVSMMRILDAQQVQ
ncbi:S-layer homology domain-containing protein [Paenibacillus sp. HWE-109]|uniref:S-layer homology domain-containing protein n=1 Tax=Paenibacillus sp. HWE-109 TaxID=1306526 RepID=UPI001EE0EEBB|nr:S-layer homology domain-containing protein [Paenibacillus sp. HWE-109]UKS28182.1 S-layer homology domain-containing protein [Paenibacillus sp. HWE-109]